MPFLHFLSLNCLYILYIRKSFTNQFPVIQTTLCNVRSTFCKNFSQLLYFINLCISMLVVTYTIWSKIRILIESSRTFLFLRVLFVIPSKFALYFLVNAQKVSILHVLKTNCVMLFQTCYRTSAICNALLSSTYSLAPFSN